MRQKIKHFFIPPIFEEEEQTRIAGIVHTLFAALFLVSLLTIIVDRQMSTISILLVTNSLAFAAYGLNRLGFSQIAGFILLTIYLAAIILLLMVGNGIHDIAITGLPVLLIMSALMLNRRSVIAFTILTIAAASLVAYAEIEKLPGIQIRLPGQTYYFEFAIIAFILGAAGLSSHILISQLVDSLARSRASEARLRGIFDNSPDFVIEIDRTGKVLLANRFPDHFIGNDIRAFVLQEYIPAVNEIIENAFETGGKSTLEIQTRDIDGRIGWNSVRIGPIKYNDQIESLTVFVSNISDNKQVEAERESLITELEMRNAELERYSYTLSHELKTPIVTIRGFQGLINQSMEAGNLERAKTDLARVGKAADKMYLMISELLELSRIGRIINPPEDVPFNDIVYAGLNFTEDSIKEHNVQVHVQPDLPGVHVDLTRMIEVIQILISNAVKYLGDQPEPQITIGVRAEQDNPIFFVSDNGIGIDPAYHERVFNIFEKLNLQSEGTGIGLAIVKRIIELHEGKIWIESEGVGKGTTFCFTLPPAK